MQRLCWDGHMGCRDPYSHSPLSPLFLMPVDIRTRLHVLFFPFCCTQNHSSAAKRTVANMSVGKISDTALRYFQEKNIGAIMDEAMHDVLQQKPDDSLAFLEHTFRKAIPLRLIVVGARGVGKTRLCKYLSEKYGIVHIDADEIQRSAERDTPSRAQCSEDDIQRLSQAVSQRVLAELKKAEAQQGCGWVLEGYPHSRAHAIVLQTAGLSPQKVFHLDSPVEAVISRYASAAETGGRMESNAEIVSDQKYFQIRQAEIVDTYTSCYVRVDSSGTPEQVAAEVEEQIAALRLT